jgi:hypothetical protein
LNEWDWKKGWFHGAVGILAVASLIALCLVIPIQVVQSLRKKDSNG